MRTSDIISESQIEQVKPIVGPWADVVGHLFYRESTAKLQSVIEAKKKDLWKKFESDKKYFDFLKTVSKDNLKAIYMVDTPEFTDRMLLEIEKDIYDGFNLNVTSHDNYNWLTQQGILIFPRYLSWDEAGPHTEWSPLTEEILLAILYDRPDVIVATPDYDVKHMILELRGNRTIYTGPGSWKIIDEYIQEKFSEKVQWMP